MRTIGWRGTVKKGTSYRKVSQFRNPAGRMGIGQKWVEPVLCAYNVAIGSLYILYICIYITISCYNY